MSVRIFAVEEKYVFHLIAKVLESIFQHFVKGPSGSYNYIPCLFETSLKQFGDQNF